MQISKKIHLIFALGILVSCQIFIGCGRQPASGGPSAANLAEVAVVTIQPKRVVVTAELAGRTAPKLVAEVRPQVGGIIQKRLFTEGSDVTAGQMLFQIDPAPFQATLDNAMASLSKSEANLTAIRLKAGRLQELLVDKAVSQQDYDDAAAALKQNEADIQYWKAMVETASINMKYTSVMAPIPGRIGRSSVTEGALVTASQPLPLVTIQQLDPIYVDVPQSTTELLRLRKRLEDGSLRRNGGDVKVSLLLEDNSRYPLDGVLQFRDVTVDPSTGSVILRIVIPNPKVVLLPGMFVKAVVEDGVNEKALLAPQQGVSRDLKGNPFALIVDSEGKVQQRPLTLERTIGNAWLVSSGLAPGDRVIVEGLQKTKPGASVKAVPFEDGSEKNAVGPKKTVPQASKAN
jgi:membrane fusion protein, multidrug efflux system